jgi:hypothetical protein
MPTLENRRFQSDPCRKIRDCNGDSSRTIAWNAVLAACWVALCLVALAPSAMAQGGVTWDPLYAKPPYDRLEWTLTVQELSDMHSYYYWAFQDAFVGGGLFYFGLQPYGGCPIKPGNCKIALFSFFGDGATSTSPHCRPGADNGPGMSCHLAYDWSMGVPYRFAIQLSATDPSGKTETWTGTVTDTRTGEVSEIGNWTFPGQKTAAPGLIYGQPVSFVEYWIMPKGGCSAQPYAKVTMSVPTGSRGAPFTWAESTDLTWARVATMS